MPITTPSTVDQPADNDNRVRGSRTAARAGWVLTSLVVLLLLIDGITHVLKIQPVLDSFRDLGFPASTAAGIGIIELVCLALHVVPRTSVLGALLLTAYLGGAVAAQVRIEAPLASTTLFPVYTAVLLWTGLCLRDNRARTLLPLRQPEQA